MKRKINWPRQSHNTGTAHFVQISVANSRAGFIENAPKYLVFVLVLRLLLKSICQQLLGPGTSQKTINKEDTQNK
jgi:hypothetical protein